MGEARQPSASALPVSAFTPSPENLLRLSLEPPVRPGLVGSLGRYEILKLIGSGGMGVVLLARNTEMSRLVAIKMIKPELAAEPRAVHRFLKEARHMQRLSHPNIVPVMALAATTRQEARFEHRAPNRDGNRPRPRQGIDSSRSEAGQYPPGCG
jgi:hypothetical protein